MKISEIIQSDMPVVFTPDEIEQKQEAYANGIPVLRISKTLQLAYVEKENAYTLVKDGNVLGWLELGETVELFGTTYDTVKMIYLVPEIRKTMAAGAFLVALKNHLPHPLILGSNEYGGVLFKDGTDLVKTLNKSSRTFVHLLNLKTGARTDFLDGIPSRPSHLTLTFENSTFPLFHEGAMTYIFEGCELRPFTSEGSL